MAKKILLVEDDLDIQRIYSEKLKNAGYDVILALNSGTALQYVKDDKPNLILLDIMLPGKMNGLEMLDRLKRDDFSSKIPVIVLTNLDTEKKLALEIGANDYLIKANTSLNDLLIKVQKLI